MKKKRLFISIFAACFMVLITLALTIIPLSAGQQPVQLTGRTTFVGYFSHSSFTFSPDWYNYCSAEAELAQTGLQSYTLEVNEWDCGRVCSWDLTITNGGVVRGENDGSCCMDGNCIDEVELHTGCSASHGTYPTYQGTWDGTNLAITSHFHGRCDGGIYWGEAWFWDGWGDLPAVDDPDGILDDGVTWDDGPAHVTFGVELTAVPE